MLGTTLIGMCFPWRLACHPLKCQEKRIQVERFLQGRELTVFDGRPERFQPGRRQQQSRSSFQSRGGMQSVVEFQTVDIWELIIHNQNVRLDRLRELDGLGRIRDEGGVRGGECCNEHFHHLAGIGIIFHD